MKKAGSLSATIKEIGLTYDIDINSFLDSISVSEDSDDTVNVKMTMFGKERELSREDGGKDGMMIPKIIVEIQKPKRPPPRLPWVA